MDNRNSKAEETSTSDHEVVRDINSGRQTAFDTDYPPPHIPSRLINRVIGGCILVALVITALMIRNMIYAPVIKPAGVVTGVSGKVVLMERGKVLSKNVAVSQNLHDEYILETKENSTVSFDGSLDPPDFTVPIKVSLHENTSILILRPPAFDIIKGKATIHVPRDSKGLLIDLKLGGMGASAQCKTEDADLVVYREGKTLSVKVYRGKVRLWSSAGEIAVHAGYESSISPGKMAREPVGITGNARFYGIIGGAD